LKRILVPIDFSDTCVKALRYAVPFAEQFGATLCLLHVTEPIVSAGDLPYLPELSDNALVEEATKKLYSLAQKEVEELVPVKAEVRLGRPDIEIVLAAKELETDLIIISTHGHTGLKHILLGSVAEKIARHAPCPVLIVRERQHDFVA
jgi:nucleotide-binding universal stress UspA family protein